MFCVKIFSAWDVVQKSKSSKSKMKLFFASSMFNFNLTYLKNTKNTKIEKYQVWKYFGSILQEVELSRLSPNQY
jgi:hypothetical protein